MSFENNRLPGYAKYFFMVASIVLTGFVVFISSPIINPLLAAMIVAALLTPFSARLERVGVPRLLASFLVIFILTILVIALSTFLSTQLASIASFMPEAQTRFNEVMTHTQKWTAASFGVSNQELSNFINSSVSTVMTNSASFLTSAITITAGFLTAFVLFFISLFFMLYYRHFFIKFLYKLFSDDKHHRVDRTLNKFREAINKYIVGLFIVILIVAVLNSIGLMGIGIGYPIFFGTLGALLLIIPFVGIIIGSIIPALFALVTTDSIWYPIGVIFVFSFVQFLEGNFITPNIIGSRVNINPFVAVWGLFIGGMFLGPLGIILAVPLLGIFKILCDDIPTLKPIGYVIGNPEPNGK